MHVFLSYVLWDWFDATLIRAGQNWDSSLINKIYYYYYLLHRRLIICCHINPLSGTETYSNLVYIQITAELKTHLFFVS